MSYDWPRWQGAAYSPFLFLFVCLCVWMQNHEIGDEIINTPQNNRLSVHFFAEPQAPGYMRGCVTTATENTADKQILAGVLWHRTALAGQRVLRAFCAAVTNASVRLHRQAARR